MNKHITEQEAEKMAGMLSKFDRGFYPFPVFVEFCRLNKLSAIEIVPLVQFEPGNPKILLIKREDNDRFWPGQYHTPGCIVRPTDSLEDAKNRVIVEEMQSPVVVIPPVLVTVADHNTERWDNLMILHWMLIEEPGVVGELFEYKRLPKNIVKSQLSLIYTAVQHFNNNGPGVKIG